MEIEAIAEKLSKALNNVSRIATSKVTLPVLNNVLIKVENKKVSLVTTNLDMAIIDFLPVSSSKDGVITVPAKLLADFVSNLPKDESIKITSDGSKVTIKTKHYSSVINGTPADDFPELPEINEEKAVIFKIGTEEFKNGMSQVVVASSNDFNRPALTGIHFHTADKTLYVAATDGYRLACKKLVKNVKSDVEVTIPAASIQEVIRSLSDDIDEVEISFNEDLVRFRLGEIEIISKLIDAEYPKYQNLIPKSSEINLTVDRDELIRITKLAALFARHSANDIITCETKTPDSFIVHSVASELGENSSVITTDVPENGKIPLISRYLLDALNAVNTNKVSIGFTSNDTTSGIPSPIVIKNNNSDDYVHIVVPVGPSDAN